MGKEMENFSRDAKRREADVNPRMEWVSPRGSRPRHGQDCIHSLADSMGVPGKGENMKKREQTRNDYRFPTYNEKYQYQLTDARNGGNKRKNTSKTKPDMELSISSRKRQEENPRRVR